MKFEISKTERQLLRVMLENDIHGKWMNGEYMFRLYFDNGTYITNEDYFKNRNIIGETNSFISKIELDSVWMDAWERNSLVDSIHNSSSFMVVSSGTSKDKVSELNLKITKLQETFQGITDVLKAINLLTSQERYIVVMHGIIGISLNLLSDELMINHKTLQKKYMKILDRICLLKMLNN